MHLERLKLFVEIVESGSVSGASRRVNLTQPAVSRNLKCLEEELGAPLFERVGHRMVLTAAGRALLPKAKALLTDIEDARREVLRRAERRYFDLRLGAVNSVSSCLLPSALTALRGAFPDLEVKLTCASSSALTTMLQDDVIDAALTSRAHDPSDPSDPSNDGDPHDASSPCDPARGVLIGAFAKRWWGRADAFPALASVTQLRDLQKLPLVELQARPGRQTLVSAAQGSFALAPSLEAIKALVLSGFGVGELPDFLLSGAERARLVSAPIEQAPRALRLVASPWRRDDALDELCRRLAAEARRALRRARE